MIATAKAIASTVELLVARRNGKQRDRQTRSSYAAACPHVGTRYIEKYAFVCRQPQTASPRVFCQINFMLIIRLIFISRTARRLIRLRIYAWIFSQKSFRRIQHILFSLMISYYCCWCCLRLSHSIAGPMNVLPPGTFEWENNSIKSGPWAGQTCWLLNLVTALSDCSVESRPQNWKEREKWEKYGVANK